MSVGLDPTTVSVAAPWMAYALGLSWRDDRAEVMENLNRYRNLLYNRYDELKLFNDVFHCMAVQTLPHSCMHVCGEGVPTFQGITLPEDVASLESAWYSNEPLKLRSRWREAHTGIGAGSGTRIELVEMAERTPIECPMTKCCKLKVWSEHEDDLDQVATITVLDFAGVEKTIEFGLKPQAWAYSRSTVGQVISVALPSGLRGRVTLAQEDGKVLSRYVPGETVPLYRRFRVASYCPSGNILIQGVKRYRPIYCDSDIVEVGDQLVIEAAGSFLRYRAKTVDTKEINRAEYDRSEMGRELAGLVARHRGNAIQDSTAMATRTVNTTHLMPGYRRR